MYKLTITDLFLQDERMSIGSFGQTAQRVFKFKEAGKRPYEFDNSIHLSITFEMELDLKVIDRQVYNFLDWVGDIGGLGEGLFFMSTTVLSIIHFGALDNQII